MEARPYNEAYLLDASDHAYLEDEVAMETQIEILLARAAIKAERVKELQQSYRVLERLRSESWQEISRVNDELASITAELRALGRTAK